MVQSKTSYSADNPVPRTLIKGMISYLFTQCEIFYLIALNYEKIRGNYAFQKSILV